MKLLTFLSTVSLLSWTTITAAVPNGVTIDSDSCSPDQIVAIQKALQAVSDQLKAGHAAVYSREQRSLFEFFFKPSDRSTVIGVYEAAQQYLYGQGTPVGLICRDILNNCITNDARAYFIIDHPVSSLKGIPPPFSRIVLCPQFFTRPVSPDPCSSKSLELYTPAPSSQTAGDETFDTYQSTMVLHELLHVPYIGGPHLPFIQDLANQLIDLHALIDLQAFGYQVPPDEVSNAVPRNNVDSYTVLAAWAWIQTQQKDKCPKSYPLFNVLQDAVQPQDRVELRRLLGEEEQDSNNTILHPNRMLGVVDCQGNCTVSNLSATDNFPSYKVGDIVFSLASGFDFTGGLSNVNYTTPDGTSLNLTYSDP